MAQLQMTRALAVCTVATTTLMLAACAGAGAGAENETDVRVIDLKLGVNPIGWRDNETIVIVGDIGERYARKDGAIESVLRVMTINYKTGHRQVFGKAGGEFCYADGYISYSFMDRATDELWVTYGELGKETTRKVKAGEFNFDRGPGAVHGPNDHPRLSGLAKRRGFGTCGRV
jgi:hypothetical protein